MLTNRYPHVFSPIQIGPVRLKNRLGFAPMVCNKCTVDGTVTDSMVEFVYQQASTGVGYVTIGDTQVDDDLGGAFMATLNIARKTSIPGMIKLTEAAGFGGTVLSVELNHSGRGAKDDLTNGQPIGPSAVCFPRCSQNVRPMERADLERVKGLFVHCAKQCVRAGFRMLMVHCAHNNLLGQFLSPLSNLRTDEYGGSPENRRRYPLEVLAAVRQAVGPDVAIEVRVSAEEITPGGLQFDESLAFMEQAQQYCDLIHVSRGIVYDDAGIYTLPTYLRPRLLNVDWARKVKERLHIPVAVVGNFSTLDEAEQVIASGAADIVCAARMYLTDHEIIPKSLAGQPETARPCLRCHRGCIDNSARGKAIHCAVNPSLGFEELERTLDLVHEQLLERFEIIANKKVYNFPFLMGEGVWLDSEKLDWNDSVREVLKHGTLSIGFIGLAECLKALRGTHHGEDPNSQNLGLEIVGFIRKYCDDLSQKEKLNYTCLATPAEGLSGRFVRIDREKYGVIPGVTDREYYTNSFHVPVYFPISAFEKLAIEAPYHALTNAGHISYIEMDGDPTKNLDAFEKVVRYMHDVGIGYGSINHPVDRDPDCGYNGIIGDTCPKCGRTENGHAFERIRRITGYLVGTLDRFNNGKRAEERDRVKHSV